MTATNNEIIPPLEYEVKSKEIARLWNLFSNTGQELDKIILEARTILENSGYSRTEAMKKIAEDHKHLRGFSLPNLYRMLPKEDKQYQSSKTRIVGEGEEQQKDSHFENDSVVELEQDSHDKEYKEYLETKQKTDEIKKQLPQKVVEYAEKYELSASKLELLNHPKLKKYPHLQEDLIYMIKDYSPQKAQDKVYQTINDVETGYLGPSETGKVFIYGDPQKRDLISGNKMEVKDPNDYYMELHQTCNKLLYLLTGYKKDEREYYTKDIINNSHNHRLDIAKSINSEFRAMYGFDERFVKPAKMAIEDMHQILNEEMDSAEKKQEMMKE